MRACMLGKKVSSSHITSHLRFLRETSLYSVGRSERYRCAISIELFEWYTFTSMPNAANRFLVSSSCSSEASTRRRIKPPPLEFPFPSVNQCAHSWMGLVFGSTSRLYVVETPNKKSLASTVAGYGDLGTGTSSAFRHVMFAGGLWRSIVSKSSGKRSSSILVMDLRSMSWGMKWIYRRPYSILSPNPNFCCNDCRCAASTVQSGTTGAGGATSSTGGAAFGGCCCCCCCWSSYPNCCLNL